MQMHKSKIEEDGNGKGRSTAQYISNSGIPAFQHSSAIPGILAGIPALPSTFIPRLLVVATIIPESTFYIWHILH